MLTVRLTHGSIVAVDGKDMAKMLSTHAYLEFMWARGIKHIPDNRQTRSALPTRMRRS